MKNTTKHRVKKVSIQETDKSLTTQAGMIPVLKFWDRHQIHKASQNKLSLKRHYHAHWQLPDAVYLTTHAIIAGARSLSDVKTIWADPVLRKVADWPDIPDDSTLGRVFKDSGEEQTIEIQELCHELRESIWNQAKSLYKGSLKRRTSCWIDIDSTVKTVFGTPEKAEKGYNPVRKGGLSYHPQLAFCAHTKEIIQGELRAGSVYTSSGIVEFVKKIQDNRPHKRLIIRADSGFFSGDLLDQLELHRDGYLIKVKMRNLDQLLAKQKWRAIRNKPGYEQCCFSHTCNGWSTARKVVAIRKVKPVKESDQLSFCEEPEYDNFCYVSSENLTPWQTHKKYGERATCETWIEEAKNQMALAHIKTHSFIANSLIFQCSILAYNTLRWMTLLSGDHKLRRWEPKTIRCFLIRIGGQLVQKSRQLTLKIPKDLLFPKQWKAWLSLLC